MEAFGFEELRLRRMVATTEHHNIASLAVMRRLGMRIARNRAPTPFFLAVVGILDNPHPPPSWREWTAPEAAGGTDTGPGGWGRRTGGRPGAPARWGGGPHPGGGGGG